MRIFIVILFCFLSLTLNAQVLGVDRSSISVGTGQVNETVDLCSDTTWIVESDKSWLKVYTQLFWQTNDTTFFVSNIYSATAPDIGFAEFLDVYVTGHDSAFIHLVAEANPYKTRTATVTVRGTNVEGYSTINVTQLGLGRTQNVVAPDKKMYIDKNGRLIVL